jgi:hypothetical protein
MKQAKEKTVISFMESNGIPTPDEKVLRILEEFKKASSMVHRTYRALGRVPVTKISNASTSQTSVSTNGVKSTNKVQINSGLV